MNLWESLFVAAIIAIVLLKVYVALNKRNHESKHLAKHSSGTQNTAENGQGEDEIKDGLTSGWDEGWLIIIALFSCAPVGLILMWTRGNWDSGTKLKITIAYLALLIGLGILALFSN